MDVAIIAYRCPSRIRLYEAQDTTTTPCSRDLCQVVTDLQHIDTNCAVEGYSCANCDLERCLQVYSLGTLYSLAPWSTPVSDILKKDPFWRIDCSCTVDTTSSFRNSHFMQLRYSIWLTVKQNCEGYLFLTLHNLQSRKPTLQPLNSMKLA